MNEQKNRPISSSKGFAEAMKVSSEFIAGIIVGGLIGWVIDYWAGTSPIWIDYFFALGICCGNFECVACNG